MRIQTRSNLLAVFIMILTVNSSLQAGDLYFSIGGNSISKVTSGGVVEVFSSPWPGFSAFGLASDSSGNIYIADLMNKRVNKLTPSGILSRFADVPDASRSLAFDPSGVLYEVGFGTPPTTISKITSEGVVSSYGTVGGFGNFTGIAFDATGNMYLAASSLIGPSAIVKVTKNKKYSVFAWGDYLVQGLVFDSSGNLYASNQKDDTGLDCSILKITPTGSVSTFASGFKLAADLAIDNDNNVYVACSDSIQKVTPSGQASVFSTHGAFGLTYVVPEPSTYILAMIVTGFIAYLVCNRSGSPIYTGTRVGH